MTSCHKCGRLINYNTITVELITAASEHVYRFDTEACLVLWVRETYIEERAVGKMGLSGNTFVDDRPVRKIKDNPQA